MSTLRYRVYSRQGHLIGTCRYAADAAIMARSQGRGATVRVGRNPEPFLTVITKVTDAEIEHGFPRCNDVPRRRRRAAA